jgi:RNA polymerase sigma factor (sigma-70 family)
MRIADVPQAPVATACCRDIDALDSVLRLIEPGIYNLALRMLSHPEDARDATQEILIRIVTHLGSFRGDAAFSTWAYRVARNHLLAASTRSREFPEVSWADLDAHLGE